MMENNSDSEWESIYSDEKSGEKSIRGVRAIPESSKKLYYTVYKQFLNWRDKNEKKLHSENTLLDYFEELSTKRKATTLWSHYSMLRSTLHIHENVDISQYIKLRKFLKRKAHSYHPRKPSIFTVYDIDKFLKEAPDSKYLLSKVVLIMGILGGCLREELRKMKVYNINDLGTEAIVEIPSRKKGQNREFTIAGRFYQYFKKYICLRPKYPKDSSFFVHYINGKCIPKNVGINTIGSMGRIIASYLNLPNPELYTAHCFRVSAKQMQYDEIQHLSGIENSGNESVTSEFEKACNEIKNIKEEYEENMTIDGNQLLKVELIFNDSLECSSQKHEENIVNQPLKQELLTFNNLLERTDISEDNDNTNLEDDNYFMTYAKYVASRLKRLDNPRLQSVCQERIDKVFFELEMNNK